MATSAHLAKYAAIVQEKATLRQLRGAGDAIIGLAMDEAAQVTDQLEKAEQSLYAVTQKLVRERFVHIKSVLNQRFDEFSDGNGNTLPWVATQTDLLARDWQEALHQ